MISGTFCDLVPVLRKETKTLLRRSSVEGTGPTVGSVGFYSRQPTVVRTYGQYTSVETTDLGYPNQSPNSVCGWTPGSRHPPLTFQ